MSLAGWLNTLWMLKCWPALRAFRTASRRLAATQAAILRHIVRQNRDTEFGRAHHFSAIADPRDFQRRVPLARYDTVAAAVSRIATGAANVLTRERIRLLEPTSGSTGGEKLIPYTESLRRQFQQGVAAWLADLFGNRPAVRRGRAYWSISPALGPRRHTPAGIPIGFDDDAAYLGVLERFALGRLLVVPAAVARLPDLEAFRYVTLRFLLAAGDLALISVWSPTFLTALLAPLDEWAGRLCDDLCRGTLTPPRPLPPDVARLLQRRLRPDPRQAETLRSILSSRGTVAEKLSEVWPRLALLSCWADAAAGRCLGEVRALFPGVEIQPKGLIATEGMVSFPLTGRASPVLAACCHFFEFEEEQSPGRCRLAHELDSGGRYRVVLTTAGGLYRYQLGDIVEVVGFEGECPLLRFLGKGDRVSDLVGEKLAEVHVREVLDRAFAALGLAPSFALLVPVEGRPARYRLYLQGPHDAPAGLREAVQAGLEENPYYRHAIRLGQLDSLEVSVLPPGGEPGWAVYERVCLARGQKAGDIKPAALDVWMGWPREFDPGSVSCFE
jgi:hypothetical protein